MELIGWVAKREFDDPKAIWDGRFNIDAWLRVFKKKGKRKDWLKEDWPPVKVRVVIEKVKK